MLSGFEIFKFFVSDHLNAPETNLKRQNTFRYALFECSLMPVSQVVQILRIFSAMHLLGAVLL